MGLFGKSKAEKEFSAQVDAALVPKKEREAREEADKRRRADAEERQRLADVRKRLTYGHPIGREPQNVWEYDEGKNVRP